MNERQNDVVSLHRKREKRDSPSTHLQEKGLVTTGMRVQDSTEPQGPDGREHLKPVATRASGHGMPCPYNNNSLTSNKILNILITVLTASHYIWSDELHANERKSETT